MIEVTIWWSCLDGDSASSYLVDVSKDTLDASGEAFNQAARKAAIQVSLERFYQEAPPVTLAGHGRAINRIDLRPVSKLVLKP